MAVCYTVVYFSSFQRTELLESHTITITNLPPPDLSLKGEKKNP
jgi:hypothetical protein